MNIGLVEIRVAAEEALPYFTESCSNVMETIQFKLPIRIMENRSLPLIFLFEIKNKNNPPIKNLRKVTVNGVTWSMMGFETTSRLEKSMSATVQKK